MPPLNPGRVMQMGLGFMVSKTVILATKLNLFTLIAHKGPMTAAQLAAELEFVTDDENFHGATDFFDTLASLALLKKSGEGAAAVYDNTEESTAFLVRGNEGYVGGLLRYCDDWLYGAWGNLVDCLKTGEAQKAKKLVGEEDFFDAFSGDLKLVEEFAYAMLGNANGHNTLFAMNYDFSKHKRAGDFGGSTGNLMVRVAQHNPHMECFTFDRPELEPIATKYIADQGMSHKVTAKTLDFFKNEFPKGLDLITMGYVLHDWGLEKKMYLIRKAFEALPPGGAFVALDGVIDDTRDTPESVPGLTMSLNMLVEQGKENAFDYTFQDFKGWAEEIGFSKCEMLPLTPATRACIAYK